MTLEKYIDIYEVGPPLEKVRKHEAKFVKYFSKCHRVLDLGAGRGIFLELLKESGIPAEGVDIESDMVRTCREKGLVCYHSDAVSFLEGKDEEYNGIFGGHLIEHLHPPSALRLVELCYAALRPGGILVILTPNPEDIDVITTKFWLDLSHIRPYPLELLEHMLLHFEFEIVEEGEHPNPLKIGPFWKRILKILLNTMRRRILGNHWDRGDIFIVGRKTEGGLHKQILSNC
jgi:2-polyprenyl-3-methyl-5-hydroxy-6-metoxy-1,4-benzoquinol methylase